MSGLIKSENGAPIDFLYGDHGELTIVKPFEKDIFLFDTHVAGTSHIAGMDELAAYLKPEDKLSFFREPDNPYDPQAIVIKNTHGVKIGYVPKADNIVFARLMDAGKLLFGRITGVKKKGNYYRIDIRIYLHE